MIIAYDLHGVLNTNPEQYKGVMKALCDTKDIEVWVISGPKSEDVLKELNTLGFRVGEHYHCIASVIDFLIANGKEYKVDKNGNYWFDEKEWWSAKAKICKEYEVYSLIDDHVEYGKYFTADHPTKFILKAKEAIPTPLNI